MQKRFDDYRIFWQEFRHTFESTGAVLPSGRSLSRALASQVGKSKSPQHILEVGPGTGAVTNSIIPRLGPHDRLDLVELNERFATVLRDRLKSDPVWQPVAGRMRILEMPVEEIDDCGCYDVIVSGLPLNNFSCDLVEHILQHFHRLAAKSAQLSFFEYVALRKAKSLWSKAQERLRLSGIERLLQREFDSWQFSRQCILANVPPAWVHHLCLPGYIEADTRSMQHAATIESAQ